MVFFELTSRKRAAGKFCTCLLAAIFVLPNGIRAQQSAQAAGPSPYLDTQPAVSHSITKSDEFQDHLKAQTVASYSVSLNRGDVSLVRFVQLKGEIGAIWIDPKRRASNVRRNDSGKNSSLQFTLLAPEDGQYEIRVRCLSSSGDCDLESRVEAPHAASGNDSIQMAAEEAAAEGDRLRRLATADSRSAALAAYNGALSQTKEIQDVFLTRHLLYVMARVALETQQYAQARDRMLEATSLPESADDIAGTAVCWKVLGYSYAYLGDLNHALSAYEEAQTRYTKSGDAFNQEILHENAARAHRAMGENDAALDELTEALGEARSNHDDRVLVASLEELGNIHISRSDLQEALDAYRQAMQEPYITQIPTTQAHVLNGLGNVYTQLGEYEWAQTAFQQSVDLWKHIKDPMGEAYALDGEAFLAYSQADYQQAIKMHLAALNLVQGTDLDRERAVILEELGESYEAAGQRDEAVNALTQALALAQKLHFRTTEASCLRSLGEIAFAGGHTAEAEERFDQARDIDDTTMNRSEQALLLADCARLERSLGHLDLARGEIDSSITVIESSRTAIRNAESRSSYFDKQRDYYDFYIGLLMEMDRLHPGQGYAAKAFDVSERARARSLLDTLQENGIESERGVDRTLVTHERQLTDQIEAKLQQLTNAEDKDAPALRTQLASLEAEYNQVKSEIREKGSGYGVVARGKTISADDLSKHALDPSAVLLEYWLGKNESYLWAVTSDSISTYRLPSIDSLQDKASALYGEYTARNAIVANETAGPRQLRIQKSEQQAELDGKILGQLLLQPAVQALSGHKTAVIVADGQLLSLPFHVLPFGGKPLIETHQVVYVPSASLLPELRRNQGRSSNQRVAVFADPVFSRSDPRVDPLARGSAPAVSTPTEDAEDLTRSAGDLGLNGFQRLGYSREEAKSIGDLLPAQNRKIALDFDANRDAVLNTDWSNYRILHFSTHALIDNVHPELSGIVLSLIAPSGKQIDGFLRVRDIYSLHIPADLVVLSACRTALGKKTRGEGVIGLSRAFSYSGAHRVLATLWNVNDRATAAFMENFYEGLLKQSLPPAEALAQAQRALARSKNWHSPYFWAPFVLMGDWTQ